MQTARHARDQPFIRGAGRCAGPLVDTTRASVDRDRSKLGDRRSGTLRGSLTDLTEHIQRLRKSVAEVGRSSRLADPGAIGFGKRESALSIRLDLRDGSARLQKLTRCWPIRSRTWSWSRGNDAQGCSWPTTM